MELPSGILASSNTTYAICRNGAGIEQINDYLLHNAAAGDIVLTLGSGDVYKQTKLFLQ